MTQFFTNSDQILSCSKSWLDDLFGDMASGGDGISTGTGQVITIGADDFFDQPKVTQAPDGEETGSGRNGVRVNIVHFSATLALRKKGGVTFFLAVSLDINR